MRIHAIGNCQTSSAVALLKILTDAQLTRTAGKDFTLEGSDIEEQDIVLYTPTPNIESELSGTHASRKIILPAVSFPGQMQDCVYANGNRIKSPIGDYHSFIALSAYACGLDEAQCLRLYNERTYRELGYFDWIQPEAERLKAHLGKHAVNPAHVDDWLLRGRFMYSVNHPMLFVVEDMLKDILDRHGIPRRSVVASDYIADPLANAAIFPVYIDHRIGKARPAEALMFRAGAAKGKTLLSLEEFVHASFEIYRQADCPLTSPRLDRHGLEKYEAIYQSELNRRQPSGGQSHPYRSKPDYCFWKRSISGVPAEDVDPVVASDLHILPEQKIATAGSCFAQHIAKRLSKEGFNYFVVEQAPAGMPAGERASRGYGVFSARYGNIYTTRQLLQLFDRAFGNYRPTLGAWQRADGRYADPFRPQILPEGHASPHEVADDQAAHLAAVRRMFEELDVFVFTLGLTECWKHIVDGAILPIAPGIAGGAMDESVYSFVNFTKDEAKDDLTQFLDKLKQVNPTAQVLLTVSPVPLMATYEDRHVLVSTTASKSILRVVADEAAREHAHVHYFPSYEIITGAFNKGMYFEEDLREVRPQGVDHVMRLFMRHMAQRGQLDERATAGDFPSGTKQADGSTTHALPYNSEADELDEIFCDEELLDDRVAGR